MGMMENAFINTKGVAYSVTAPIELRDDKTNGVIIAQAGAFGGWSLFMQDGKVSHEYNYFGIEWTRIEGKTPLAAGKHVIRYEFTPDQATPGAGGACALYVNDQKVADGHIPKTQPFAFSGDEGVDVGVDGETAVSKAYKQGQNRFTGKIDKITVTVKPAP